MREEKAVLVATCSNIRLEKREGMLPIDSPSILFIHCGYFQGIGGFVITELSP